MENEFWAIVSIVVHPNKNEINESGNYRVNHYTWHTLRSWDYPKWIVDRHKRFFVWVQSLYQVRFPRHYISFHYFGYKKEDEGSAQLKRKREISAAMAQVTRIENLIKEYSEERSKTLFSDLSNDEIYMSLLRKLENKKFALQQIAMSE
jgi:hypothetical protein